MPPQAEAAFLNMMRGAMGKQGQDASAKALSDGIDRMKEDVTKSNAAANLPHSLKKV